MAETELAPTMYTAPRHQPLLAGILLALAITGLLLAFLWGRPVNHDVAWYLIATREWLGGARLYVDIYEVNPPLNFYLTAPSILLSDLTGIGDENALHAYVCLLILSSLSASWKILAGQGDLPTPRRLVFLAGVAFAFIVPALRDIGQREQLMVILATPWLLAQLPRRAPLSPGAMVALALAAAIGICLKPFFLLLPLAVTLWQVLSLRSLRPILSTENLTMLLFGMAYVAAAYVLHPEYFSDVIPVARDVYGAIALTEGLIYRTLATRVLPYLPFAVACFVYRPPLPGLGLFATAALAALGGFLVQWNGFPYHIIPFTAFAAMGAFWALAHLRGLKSLTLAASFGLAFTTFWAAFIGPYRNGLADAFVAQADPAWRPESLMVLSTHIMAGPPVALAMQSRWTSRYPHAWLIPGALNGLRKADCTADPARCDRLNAILHRSLQENVDDLVHGRPEILAIHKATDFVDDPAFSWYKLMETAPGWAEAMHGYRKASSGTYFDIWLRCDGATGAIAESCAKMGG